MSTSPRITIEPATTAEPPAQPKRRQYSVAEKRRIVEASFAPNASVARRESRERMALTPTRFSVGVACTNPGGWAGSPRRDPKPENSARRNWGADSDDVDQLFRSDADQSGAKRRRAFSV
jgi:hypothetical protein